MGAEKEVEAVGAQALPVDLATNALDPAQDLFPILHYLTAYHENQNRRDIGTLTAYHENRNPLDISTLDPDHPNIHRSISRLTVRIINVLTSTIAVRLRFATNMVSANWLLNPPSLHANDRRVEEANKAVGARAVAKAAVEVEEVKAAALDQAVRITSAKAPDTAIRTPDQLNLTLILIPHPLTPTNCTLTVTDMEVAAGADVEVEVEVDAAAAVAVAVGAILDPAISDILPVPDRVVVQHLFLVRRHLMSR